MAAVDIPSQAPFDLYTADLPSDDEEPSPASAEGEHEAEEPQNQPTFDLQPAPSSPSSSYHTETESVREAPAYGRMSSAMLAFGLWCERACISRSDYGQLREVWILRDGTTIPPSAQDADEDRKSEQLPMKLDTLKRRVRAQLPLLRLMRKPISVRIEKMPSMPASDKTPHNQSRRGRVTIERKTWHYWYDPVDLVTQIMSASRPNTRSHGIKEYHSQCLNIQCDGLSRSGTTLEHTAFKSIACRSLRS